MTKLYWHPNHTAPWFPPNDNISRTKSLSQTASQIAFQGNTSVLFYKAEWPTRLVAWLLGIKHPHHMSILLPRPDVNGIIAGYFEVELTTQGPAYLEWDLNVLDPELIGVMDLGPVDVTALTISSGAYVDISTLLYCGMMHHGPHPINQWTARLIAWYLGKTYQPSDSQYTCAGYILDILHPNSPHHRAEVLPETLVWALN